MGWQIFKNLMLVLMAPVRNGIPSEPLKVEPFQINGVWYKCVNKEHTKSTQKTKKMLCFFVCILCVPPQPPICLPLKDPHHHVTPPHTQDGNHDPPTRTFVVGPNPPTSPSAQCVYRNPKKIPSTAHRRYVCFLFCIFFFGILVFSSFQQVNENTAVSDFFVLGFFWSIGYKNSNEKMLWKHWIPKFGAFSIK